MKALILAAGYATRLYPLTLNRAKPLLPVGEKTMIDRVIDKLNMIDEVDIIYVVTNQKFSRQFSDWAVAKKNSKPIVVINDKTLSNDDRLGAIGDIGLAIREGGIADDLIVVAGDNLFEFDLNAFVRFAQRKSSPAIAVHDIREKKLASLYGVLEIDDNAKVMRFHEKPAQPQSTLVSTCIYYFPKSKLKLVGTYLNSSEKQDAPGNYIKWLAENDEVHAFAFTEAWYDIGDKESLNEVQKIYGGK
jgi:glucose-1-phosphate thymidylyltransferase